MYKQNKASFDPNSAVKFGQIIGQLFVQFKHLKRPLNPENGRK